MTVLDSTPRDQYTATSGQTVFPYTFEIAAAGDIKVLQNGTLINQGTGAGQYAVSGVGVDAGGNVTLVTGATAGDVLTIYRDMAYERLTAYTNAGDFLAADVNNDFDRLWLALQQNGGDLDGRVLIAPNTDPTSIDMTIPAKADRLDKFLKFNPTTGNPEAATVTDVYVSSGFQNYNFIGNGSTTAFTLGTAPLTENNTQVYIDGVYQEKGTYSVSGATLTFSTAPPNLSGIEVMVVQVLPVGSTTASQVSFTQAGSTYGSNVQLKLQESVSVKDFGAVGDGVADDTAAIQAAIDAVSAIGGCLIGNKNDVYVCSTIYPKSNVSFDLCGSTLKVKDNSNTSNAGFIDGYTVANGNNFQLLNGVIDGNQDNNTTAFAETLLVLQGWENCTIKNITFTDSYTTAMSFGDDFSNIKVENVIVKDSGVSGNPHSKFSYGLEAYTGTGLSVENFKVENCFGFGIHFVGCTEFSANNLTFDTLTTAASICITFSGAKRGTVSNVYCTGVTGDNIEINDSEDITLINTHVNAAGRYALLVGQLTSPNYNKRIVIDNFYSTSTTGVYSAVLSFVIDCSLRNIYVDKKINHDLTASPSSAGNKLSKANINDTIVNNTSLFRQSFILEDVEFTDYTLDSFTNSRAVVGDFVTVANGAAHDILLNDLAWPFVVTGNIGGNLRLLNQFTANNLQGSYQEVSFMANNAGSAVNLSAVTSVANSVSRVMTITGDAANEKIVLTNSSGVDLYCKISLDFLIR